MTKQEIQVKIELLTFDETIEYTPEYVEGLILLDMMEKLKDKIIIEKIGDNTWTGKLVVLGE